MTLSSPASVSTSVMVSMLWALAPGVGIAEFSLGNRLHVELTMMPNSKAWSSGLESSGGLPRGGGKGAQSFP